jgi:hypothetical protein
VKRVRDFAVIGVALVLVGFFAFTRDRQAHAHPVSVPSTYDRGSGGYRLLYTTLERAGLRVSRFERELPLLDPAVRTLVITGYEGDPSAQPITPSDAMWLTRFVRDGGRLVVVDIGFSGSHDFTPGVGTTDDAQSRSARAVPGTPFTRDVGGVVGDIPAVFPRAVRAVPLLRTSQGFPAVAYPYGRGVVIAVASLSFWDNAHLQQAGNLRLAWNAIAGHGVIAFDERVHGYDADASLWSVLPRSVRIALIITSLAAILWLIGANVRAMPAVPVDAPDERDSSDYITAMAALLRRARRATSSSSTLSREEPS